MGSWVYHPLMNWSYGTLLATGHGAILYPDAGLAWKFYRQHFAIPEIRAGGGSHLWKNFRMANQDQGNDKVVFFA